MTRLGIVTPETLARNRRYAVLVIAVVAMLLPGTDPVTMLISMASAAAPVRAQSWCSSARRAESGAAPRRSPSRRGGPPARLIRCFSTFKAASAGASSRSSSAPWRCCSWSASWASGSAAGGTGGIFDALGLGGDSASSGNPQFDQQIDDAQASVDANPKDEKALLKLAEIRYQAGQAQLEQDPDTGQPVVTDDARTNFEAALDAWEDYLEARSEEARPGCGLVRVPGVCPARRRQGRRGGAADRRRGQPERRNRTATSPCTSTPTATFEEGDAAAAKAVALAEPPQRASIKKQLAQVADQAQKLQQQAEKQAKQAQQQAGGGTPAPGGAPIEDPFGSLGGTGGAALPARAPSGSVCAATIPRPGR